jgi:hypothetical protein
MRPFVLNLNIGYCDKAVKFDYQTLLNGLTEEKLLSSCTNYDSDFAPLETEVECTNDLLKLSV